MKLLLAALLVLAPEPALPLQAADNPPQDSTQFVVAAYWGGRDTSIDRSQLETLTHINYSFVHLRGGRIVLRNPKDSVTLARLVALKRQFPRLKISVSLGGWGGCPSCSETFSTPEGRTQFALSVQQMLRQYRLDGIDLDWEFPAIEGFPGHRFAPEDRHDFTLMLRELRQVLDDSAEITFAAGGFSKYLTESVEWANVAPLVDRIYLMSYDLVNGYSTVTGNHTPLFSTPEQRESADYAARFLDSCGVPSRKIVIGAAFYARIWSGVADTNHGLYQNGTFANFVGYKNMDAYWSEHPGFQAYWDSTAQAPYRYNPREKLFATFDNRESVSLKTRYALQHHLGGIMFWELSGDKRRGGLLDAIDSTLNSAEEASRKDQ